MEGVNALSPTRLPAIVIVVYITLFSGFLALSAVADNSGSSMCHGNAASH